MGKVSVPAFQCDGPGCEVRQDVGGEKSAGPLGWIESRNRIIESHEPGKKGKPAKVKVFHSARCFQGYVSNAFRDDGEHGQYDHQGGIDDAGTSAPPIIG